MSDKEIVAWIFLAIAMASQTDKSKLESIMMIADGINHAIPTHQELQFSIRWLLKNKLVEKFGKLYSLSETGDDIYRKTNSNTIHESLRKLKKS